MPEPRPDPTMPSQPTSSPRFKGRAAVITGAARGIGRAHALHLAREGCDLVLAEMLEDLPDEAPYPKASHTAVDETVRGAEDEGVRGVAVQADVSDPAQARDLIKRTTPELGRLEFLISNAAVTREGPLADMSPETFDTVIRSNLHGIFHVLGPALKVMGAQKRGPVIGFASGAGRKEAVSAKPIPTRDDYLEAERDVTPMGFDWVKREDVAAASVFLFSEEARFISGDSFSGDSLSVDAAEVATWI